MACLHYPTPRGIKINCVDLCGGKRTAERHASIQISIGFCVNLSVSVSVLVSASVSVPGSTTYIKL